MIDTVKIDLTIEDIIIEDAKMSEDDVNVGCWGDSGSDWANNC